MSIQENFKLHDLQNFVRKYRIYDFLIFILVLASLALGYATYAAFSKTLPYQNQETSKQLLLLLNFDLIIVLLLGVSLTIKFIRFKGKNKGRVAGYRLHAKLIRWFGLLVVTPAVLITIFSALFFNMGIESWFSSTVKTAITKSTEVAEAYLAEHKKVIGVQANDMAREIAGDLNLLINDPEVFNQYVNRQAELRNLTEAAVFNSDPRMPTLMAKSNLTFTALLQNIKIEELEEAKIRPVIIESHTKDRVRALVQLAPNVDLYLMVGRLIDPKVQEKIEQTESAASEYHKLEKLRAEYEVKFIMIFIAVALLIFLLVIWIGLSFATKFAKPIGDLTEASEQIREGNLSFRVNIPKDDDEISILSKAFNNMASDLEQRQSELVIANNIIDRRRQFIEAVLSGVSSGVIGLDINFEVNIVNKSACTLLGIKTEKLIGQNIEKLMPEISELLHQDGAKKLQQGQISLDRKDQHKTFNVIITTDKSDEELQGYIVTFDDITELINAQRKSAWADVARRIAHDIKNPLTPIQLAAERLKSKFTPLINEETEIFHKYIDTISRQVFYIGEMVDEFSEFARMPNPIMLDINLVEICEQIVLLLKNANRNIEFEFITSSKKIVFHCDAGQMSRAINNLLINSIHSIQEKQQKDPELKGKIKINVDEQDHHIKLVIEDNGLGFPVKDRAKLTDPYFTKKEKGTGLGLAIVKRIVEDHNGNMLLEDAIPQGAKVTINFETKLR